MIRLDSKGDELAQIEKKFLRIQNELFNLGAQLSVLPENRRENTPVITEKEITVLEEKNELLFEHIIKLKQTKSFAASKCDDLQKCKYCEFTLMCERGEYL